MDCALENTLIGLFPIHLNPIRSSVVGPPLEALMNEDFNEFSVCGPYGNPASIVCAPTILTIAQELNTSTDGK